MGVSVRGEGNLVRMVCTTLFKLAPPPPCPCQITFKSKTLRES